MVPQGGVFDKDLVGRCHREVQHIDAVAASGGGETVVVGAGIRVLLAAPLVRLVVACGGIGDELVGAVHGQHQIDDAVATDLGGEHLLRVNDAILARQRVKAVSLVTVTLADGVIDGHLDGLVDSKQEVIDILASVGIRDGVSVESGAHEVVATPQIGQRIAAHHSCVMTVDRGVHCQVQRKDAVAAVDSLQGVAVNAAHSVVIAAPAVRHFALADGGGFGRVVTRVHHEGEVVGAVTAEGGL